MTMPTPISTAIADMGLVLIGPPGVGKGTQAARLRDEFELEHVATGDLLREHRAGDTELGRQASEYMTAGRLVPDDLVVAMVRERIETSRRFLLDGFPRTLAQADALDGVLRLTHRELTAAVFVDAPNEIVVERIAGRADGRDDDDRATVRRRLEQYHRNTAPVIDHYARLGLLHRIDASRPVEQVYDEARALLFRLCINGVHADYTWPQGKN
jgi:adenylate kinase